MRQGKVSDLDGSRILPLGTTKMWGGGALLTSPRDNTREGGVGDPIAPWRGSLLAMGGWAADGWRAPGPDRVEGCMADRKPTD